MSRNGCLCANVVLTSSQISSLNKRWTGHVQLRHKPILRKCHHLSLSNDSLLVSVPSPPVLTLSNSKGNNSKGKNSIVQQHMEAEAPPPLRMTVSGTAGTGKTHCIRLFLGDKVRVAAPTSVEAFNIDGHTLHSLLSLPTKSEYKHLEENVCTPQCKKLPSLTLAVLHTSFLTLLLSLTK